VPHKDSDVSVMSAQPMPPSVSVVIPCWNAETWIALSIKSVLEQGHAGTDVIVIDDGSTDGSLGIIKSFGDRIRWESGLNKGASAARNRGLELASSEYVLFLDADDELGQNYLASLCNTAAQTAADLIIGRCTTSRRGQVPPLSCTHQSALELFTGIIRGSYFIHTSQMLFRSNFLRQIGGWCVSLTCLQDVEISLRGLLNGPTLAYAEGEASCIYRDHDSPTRISKRTGKRELVIKVAELLLRIAKLDALRPDDAFSRVLNVRLYNMARTLVHWRELQLSRECLKAARALGLRGHRGSPLHVLTCHVLGLTLKERLRASFSRG
jgi:glycosyltransferase involved in cell wall biosynthesis